MRLESFMYFKLDLMRFIIGLRILKDFNCVYYLRAGIFLIGICIIFTAFVKTEFLLAEIRNQFDIFKIFHILTVNSKLLHQLTNKNYKRLAIRGRIIIIIFINYGSPFFSILLPSFFLLLAVLTK